MMNRLLSDETFTTIFLQKFSVSVAVRGLETISNFELCILGSMIASDKIVFEWERFPFYDSL